MRDVRQGALQWRVREIEGFNWLLRGWKGSLGVSSLPASPSVSSGALRGNWHRHGTVGGVTVVLVGGGVNLLRPPVSGGAGGGEIEIERMREGKCAKAASVYVYETGNRRWRNRETETNQRGAGSWSGEVCVRVCSKDSCYLCFPHTPLPHTFLLPHARICLSLSNTHTHINMHLYSQTPRTAQLASV